VHCRGCHYALRRLATNRCPECGRAFDPDDRDSYVKAPGEPTRLARSVAASVALNIGVVVALLLVSRGLVVLFF
jgi:predicted amidophosphoribosyltransferase